MRAAALTQSSRAPDAIAPALGKSRPASGEFGPTLGKIHPSVVGIDPTLGKIRPSMVGIDPTLGKIHPLMGGIRPGLGKVQPATGEIAPTPGKIQSPPPPRSRSGIQVHLVIALGELPDPAALRALRATVAAQDQHQPDRGGTRGADVPPQRLPYFIDAAIRQIGP